MVYARKPEKNKNGKWIVELHDTDDELIVEQYKFDSEAVAMAFYNINENEPS